MPRGKSSRARGCSSSRAPGLANAGATSSTLSRRRSLLVNRRFVPSLEAMKVRRVPGFAGIALVSSVEPPHHVDEHVDLAWSQLLDHVRIFLREFRVDVEALVLQPLDVAPGHPHPPYF